MNTGLVANLRKLWLTLQPGAPMFGGFTVKEAGNVINQAADELERNSDIAAATAHRACCSSEHHPANGKLHGYCVVCGVPWPCETASYFLRPTCKVEVKI